MTPDELAEFEQELREERRDYWSPWRALALGIDDEPTVGDDD